MLPIAQGILRALNSNQESCSHDRVRLPWASRCRHELEVFLPPRAKVLPENMRRGYYNTQVGARAGALSSPCWARLMDTSKAQLGHSGVGLQRVLRVGSGPST